MPGKATTKKKPTPLGTRNMHEPGGHGHMGRTAHWKPKGTNKTKGNPVGRASAKTATKPRKKNLLPKPSAMPRSLAASLKKRKTK